MIETLLGNFTKKLQNLTKLIPSKNYSNQPKSIRIQN